ncbi:MAG: hypothetical protein VXZ13_15625, partial [Pseudomonadota bacterium]|nr:hypothetical protein [Pseudomonadota bacterium]
GKEETGSEVGAFEELSNGDVSSDSPAMPWQCTVNISVANNPTNERCFLTKNTSTKFANANGFCTRCELSCFNSLLILLLLFHTNVEASVLFQFILSYPFLWPHFLDGNVLLE